MVRNMSNAELSARKHYQSASWKATGTLGLTGAALGTGALVLTKKPGAFKALPGLKKATPEKLRNMGVYTGLAGGGIGGLGSFNSAKISQAEARKIKKSDDGFTPIGSEEGIAKNWSPTVAIKSPEQKRHERNAQYKKGGEVVGGAGLTTSAAFGVHAVHSARTGGKSGIQNTKRFKNATTAGKFKVVASDGAKYMKVARRSAKIGLASAALGAGGIGTATVVHNRQKDSWKSY